MVLLLIGIFSAPNNLSNLLSTFYLEIPQLICSQQDPTALKVACLKVISLQLHIPRSPSLHDRIYHYGEYALFGQHNCDI